MIRPSFNPASCISTCTRFRVRKTTLIQPEEYHRLMEMSLSGIAKTLSERGYGTEILALSLHRSGSGLLETALSRNLTATYHSALAMTQEPLRTFVLHYLNRWDIANLLAILRGKQQGFPLEQVHDILVPAGELDETFLNHLMGLSGCSEVTAALAAKEWALHMTVAETYRTCGMKRVLAPVENALYQEYYRNLIAYTRAGHGSGPFLHYLRREIDFTNLRNLLRLRCYGKTCSISDFAEYMIPGGTVPLDLIRILYHAEDHEVFADAFKKTGILPSVTRALVNLHEGAPLTEDDAVFYVWNRWKQRKRVIHEVEIAVTRVHLEELDRMTRRHPFSALPAISYLEEKRYEVANLRAIFRGRAAGMAAEEIRRYLVL
ncbi:MAG: hypothetical protein CVV32_11605 [Methanomicrobiales archaeon HGW-Methanomicrobiales-3]|jgi:V/A-type H+-transporting ATPase subunit C|nr:MAG: hypothetical protein CVV32_11605 [Methanomicrobiales archaeon HGW-Methanomicrobiales-3]